MAELPELPSTPRELDIEKAVRRALLQAGEIQQVKRKLRELCERTAKMIPPELDQPQAE